ncbi:MAG: hypothetical protein MZV64_37765 [Ignavibacteriales bacterium]|nr:hypothetical protein [Ignavibacteriales bacterium]
MIQEIHDICLVFAYHKKFNSVQVDEIEAGCRSGALGCVDCKMNCTSKISEFLEPIRSKRPHYENNLSEVKDILHEGERKARLLASETMKQVRDKMKIG